MIVAPHSTVWIELLQKPLSQRIGPAPRELIAHIASVNASAGHPYDAEPAAASEDFSQDICAAVDEMPTEVKRRLHGSLLGVYLARGVGSSAVSDVVVTPNGDAIGFVTVLDCDAFLARTANEWASWRENIPFAKGGSYAIEAVIEKPEDDNRKNALQYLLLHEFGHVLAAGNTLLPSWWIEPHWYKPTDEYTFLPISWQIAMSNEIIPLLREDFELRKRIVYYAEARLANGDMVKAYEALERTGFASLYAATSVFEDFAESFASYVHVVLMKKPFEIRIRRDGELVNTYKDCWSGGRCSEKHRILHEFLGKA